MTGAIKKSSKVQIQKSEKGTNRELVNAQIQKNEHIVTSLQTSREDGFENNHNRLEYLIAIQTTKIVMINDKVKRNINIFIMISKKDGDKINKSCGIIKRSHIQTIDQ